MSAQGVKNILIASAHVPFTSGGAEVLIAQLKKALVDNGYTVDVVQLPFVAQPKESLLKQVAIWRALDVRHFAGRDVDMVLCTKFPSYMVSHPRKVLWLIHQYRQIYDLYGTRFGDVSVSPDDEALRRMLLKADKVALGECVSRFTISDNVRDRLSRYLDCGSKTLVPPLPLENAYYSGKSSNYILSVGRICSIKRVDLIVKAMAQIDDSLVLKVVGEPDELNIESYLHSEIDKHHLWDRVEFLGKVDNDRLLALYAHAFVVYYAPFDEDLGFVTMEALKSGRPVITASDSGGSLSYVEHEKNGLVVQPNEQSIADAINRLVHDKDLYERLHKTASLGIDILSWKAVVNSLIGGNTTATVE